MFFAGANRAVFRDMEAINKMIEYVGRPELSDLHVFCIMVISNCLEDTESMEVRVVIALYLLQFLIYLGVVGVF